MHLSSTEEVVTFLSSGAIEELSFDDIDISGELAQFTLKFDGKNYNSTVPSELARGLWEYQEEIYRAVAFALYGFDDIRKLTTEQRANFQLVFEVSEGSTALLASLTKFLEKLGEGITTMESKDKAKTIIAVALIMTLVWGATSVVEAQSTVKKEEIKAGLSVSQEQERTKQFQVITDLAKYNPVAERFSKASEEGAKAIIKGASDATKIKLGKVSFDKAEIQEVTQRATKEKATAQILTESFIVLGAEFREKTSTKFWLAKEGAEFPVQIIDEDIDADSLKKLWEAARNRKPIELEVNVTIIRGKIKSGQVIKVL